MSIDMVNDVLDTITVDPMDDGLFPYLDNIVSGKTRAVDSPSRTANNDVTLKVAPDHLPLDPSQPGLATWATGYDHDRTHATQPQSFQFGSPGVESNDVFINFPPVPAPPSQWWYPVDGGAGSDGAYCESQYSPSPPSESTDVPLPTDGDSTPSASSSTAGGGMTQLWHGLTPPGCDVTSTGMDHSMYMDGSSWAEQVMTTGLETNPEFSWDENAVLEPDVLSHQSESTQCQSVRPSLQKLAV